VAVAGESGGGDVEFELLDAAGIAHPFAWLRTQFSMLPEAGPFCSLRGEFRSLVAKTDRDVSVVFHIAWYSPIARDSL
jgi:hypothetical protein